MTIAQTTTFHSAIGYSFVVESYQPQLIQTLHLDLNKGVLIEPGYLEYYPVVMPSTSYSQHGNQFRQATVLSNKHYSTRQYTRMSCRKWIMSLQTGV